MKTLKMHWNTTNHGIIRLKRTKRERIEERIKRRKKTKMIIALVVLVLIFLIITCLGIMSRKRDESQSDVSESSKEEYKENYTKIPETILPTVDSDMVTRVPSKTETPTQEPDKENTTKEPDKENNTQEPDKENNTQEPEVEVTPEPVIIPELEKSDPDNPKRVYLTFDDGPSVNTPRILDILKEYNVKATFFVNGKTTDFSKEMYKRIVDEGHTLAMHSYSHSYEDIYASVNAFSKDINKLADYLEEVTGVRPKYYRFPGGSSNNNTKVSIKKLIKHLNSKGIRYFDWNVQNSDAQARVLSKEELVANVVTGVNRYQDSIVLMHDARSKDNTVESLPILIERLQQSGAQILPIDDDTPSIVHVE